MLPLVKCDEQQEGNAVSDIYSAASHLLSWVTIVLHLSIFP